MNIQKQAGQLVCNHVLVQYYSWTNRGIDEQLPVLLFLHGWRSDGSVWFSTVGRLMSMFPSVYVLDLPGFGKSQTPQGDWELDDYSTCVREFAAKLQLQDVCLIGHSFGGRIAIKLASEDSTLWRKIILVNSGGIRRKRTKTNMLMFLAKVVKPFFSFSNLQGLRTKIYHMLGAEDYLATPNIQRTFVHVINENLETDLRKVFQQALLVWGDRDLETPLADGKRMRSCLSDGRLVVISGAGHYSFLDKPDEFVKLVSQFAVSA